MPAPGKGVDKSKKKNDNKGTQKQQGDFYATKK